LSKQWEKTGEIIMKKRKKLLSWSLALVAVLALFARVFAQAPAPSYQLLTTITLPGGLAGFDISWVDPGSQRFYLADRTATKGTGRIDVIDTQANTLLYTLPTTKSEIGFTGTVPTVTPGCSISGPNGVVAIPQKNQLYVGDGDSTVKVVDLAAKAIVAIIPTGGKCRADELAYDPLDHIIMIANPSDNPPYLNFISADTQTVVGRYTYGAGQVGLEQAVWNPLTKRFYISVPATANTVGSVDVINPITMLKEASYQTTTCSPAGLVLTPNQHLMTSCGVVLDARTGTILATVAGPSTDQLWYNPGDNRYYFGAPGVAVVDADTNQILATLPSAAGHTLAVDPNNNRIFAPVSGAGIKVFAAQ
jgi:hypothetical protein